MITGVCKHHRIRNYDRKMMKQEIACECGILSDKKKDYVKIREAQ
jgi:hypothetical protein